MEGSSLHGEVPDAEMLVAVALRIYPALAPVVLLWERAEAWVMVESATTYLMVPVRLVRSWALKTLVHPTEALMTCHMEQ